MTLGEDADPSRRTPLYVRPPANWADVTDDQKRAFALELLRELLKDEDGDCGELSPTVPKG
jgi:hypothetical protein